MEDVQSPQSAKIWKDKKRTKKSTINKKTLWNVTFVLKFCVFPETQYFSSLEIICAYFASQFYHFTFVQISEKFPIRPAMSSSSIPALVAFFEKSALYKKQDSILPTNVHFFPLSLCSAWDNAHRLQETFLLDPKLPSNTYILLLSNTDIFLSYWTIHPHHNSTHS